MSIALRHWLENHPQLNYPTQALTLRVHHVKLFGACIFLRREQGHVLLFFLHLPYIIYPTPLEFFWDFFGLVILLISADDKL